MNTFRQKGLSRAVVLLGGLALLLALAGCTKVKTGPVETESRSVDLGSAASVDVKLSMGIGELKVKGGASGLLSGAFKYNVADWKPTVAYNVTGTNGELTVAQPTSKDNPLFGSTDGVEYQWNLGLNDNTPMNLTVSMGAGTGDLSLGSLSLKNLDVNVGAGDTVVDLTGTPKQDLKAHIKGGVGEVSLHLPSNAGVRVSVQHGVGSVHSNGLSRSGDTYTNDAYGKSERSMEITVESGVGDVSLDVAK